MTAPHSTPTERDDVAAVLAAHVWWPGSPRDGNPGCYCGWRCPVAKGVSRHDLHAAHVSDQLGPLIAAREQAARAEALREAADDWHDIEQALEAIEDIILDDEDRPFTFTPAERRRIAVCEVLVERADRIGGGE